MAKKYDVVAVVGEYESHGEKKAAYRNVGAVFEKEGKFYLKLTHLVTVHEDSGQVVNFFSLFEPKKREPF